MCTLKFLGIHIKELDTSKLVDAAVGNVAKLINRHAMRHLVVS